MSTRDTILLFLFLSSFFLLFLFHTFPTPHFSSSSSPSSSSSSPPSFPLFLSLALLSPSPLSSFQVSEPTVELLYDAKAKIGEGPFYEPQTNQLLWVDIVGHSINFLDVDKKENRYNIYRISFISSRP